MLDIDLQQYSDQLRVKTEGGKRLLWDAIRRKWLVLQPEELVRQLVLHYLLSEKKFNKNRIRLEKGLEVNTRAKRCDILVYDIDVTPWLLIECKAPQVDITDDVFRQVATYNLPLRVPYIMVTNGMEHFCCQITFEKNVDYVFLNDLPDYPHP